MVQIDDEASSMVRSSLNGLDWLPDADGGIGVGDADSEGSWVAADSGDWWLEDQRRQRLHPGDIYSPGNAIKASDCLAISAFLWCISDTAFTSPTVSPDICIYCQQQQGVEENLQQLQRMLLRIQTVVEEANGRRITNQAMLLQLKTMRNVMYRGYYFLDNFRYRIALGHAPDEVDDHSLASFPFNPLKRFRFSTMARKIVSEDQEKKELLKMLGRLESIISEEFVMSLRSYPRMVRQPYCSYLLLENCMFGRQAEQERIISFLLEPHRAGAEGVAVLPIIGPARVGKSTLVENVCHDERVRKYFSTIVFYYTGSTEGAVADTGVIKHQNPASTKQSLVVIELVDDMDDETWRRILSSLRGDNIAAPVSKIIITSQSNKIATFGTTETLQLDMLPKEAFWYFLKTIAFGSTNPEEEPKLTSICMEIAAQANGAFLHANIIGGILRSNFSVQF
uniref:Disease resistance N-terminal domain-containing protein n=1 Tax=Oryza rufipogon TaxID=4529 RepID=A0A0E0NI19_ORYRU